MIAVEICPICDIAGCRHIRERNPCMTHTDEELDALVKLAGEFVTATWHLLDNSETSGPIDDPTITVWQPNFDEVSELLDRCECLPNGSTEHLTAGELLAGNMAVAIAALRAQLAAANARAEAALAAQIEADAGIADAQEAKANKRRNDADDETQSDWDGGVLFGTEIGARIIAAAIRAQPHDRTALARRDAATRAKALRDAADVFMDGSAAKIAILAMIDREASHE